MEFVSKMKAAIKVSECFLTSTSHKTASNVVVYLLTRSRLSWQLHLPVSEHQTSAKAWVRTINRQEFRCQARRRERILFSLTWSLSFDLQFGFRLFSENNGFFSEEKGEHSNNSCSRDQEQNKMRAQMKKGISFFQH